DYYCSSYRSGSTYIF
nr:immunoglobulin light chain junction region [Macaca mulatta]MOV98238.1 immunoglobulin light chain junction region [Macaca mulatta]MOW58538.1 immunoglobulin light chain junction region [Macaca mulatta]MOW59737.1 immunoglobulin light chain junction region [Macaca mulatta]